MNLNKLNLNKILVFTEVAREKSVTKAAMRLSLTTSAVSQAVSSLEASLGIKLLERTPKGSLTLTRAGEEIFSGATKNFDALQKVLSHTCETPDTKELVVRLGLFVGFSAQQIAPAISKFLGRYPLVQIKTFSASLHELDRLLEAGKLDIVLSLRSSRSASKQRSRRVMKEELILVSRQKPPTRKLDYREILEAPFVDYYENDPLIHRWIQHHFRTRTKKIHIRAYAATAELVMELIQNGIGAGVVPRSVVQPHLAKKELFAVLGKRAQLSQEVWINRANSAHHHRGSILIDFEKDICDFFQA